MNEDELYYKNLSKAGNLRTSPDELIELGGDQNYAVRHRISTNPSTPLEGLMRLGMLLGDLYDIAVIKALEHPNMTPHCKQYLQAKLYLTHYDLQCFHS